jgi:hypothetical protein
MESICQRRLLLKLDVPSIFLIKCFFQGLENRNSMIYLHVIDEMLGFQKAKDGNEV